MKSAIFDEHKNHITISPLYRNESNLQAFGTSLDYNYICAFLVEAGIEFLAFHSSSRKARVWSKFSRGKGQVEYDLDVLYAVARQERTKDALFEFPLLDWVDFQFFGGNDEVGVRTKGLVSYLGLELEICHCGGVEIMAGIAHRVASLVAADGVGAQFFHDRLGTEVTEYGVRINREIPEIGGFELSSLHDQLVV